MDSQKYYYLKLKEDFYESDELLMLQKLPDGYLYSDILMKLYLRSLRSGGKLMYKDLIPYSPEMIATICRHQVGTVEKALKYFREMGLIEVLDNGAIYMMDIQTLIGKSSTEADRKREYRQKIDQEKKGLIVDMSSMPRIEEKKASESKPAISSYSAPFEELWKEYPRKADKASAYKKYQARIKDGFSHEELFEATKAYAEKCRKEHTEERYIKHGKTFFGESTPFLDYVSKKDAGGGNEEISASDNPYGIWE